MIELTYEAAMHVRDSHAMTVLGRDDHVLGIGAFHGLANFADGRVATHRYDGWYDLIDGSGRFHGYALWQFEDGSEIRAVYDGEARESGAEGFEVGAQIRVVSGTGRFAGASGDGGFQGRRIEPIERGGRTQLSGTLRLERAR
jgi:hypothetical protein